MELPANLCPSGTRFLLTSTPRSGNTWFRQMLGASLTLAETAVHSPPDLDWDTLPDRAIVQMHWHRTPRLVQLLERFRLQPIVIIRHPLDVLISILHFAAFEPQTARWLGGEGGSEAPIIGRTPADPAFLEYALSSRARALLSISPKWVTAGAAFVRYEQLVAAPVATLSALLAGRRLVRPVEETVARHGIEQLRKTNANCHFWRGEPGLWRSLLPARVAWEIYVRHRFLFDSLGYHLRGAADLTVREIEHKWSAL